MNGTKRMYFSFLNALRKSGKINMFGAPAVLAKTFGITRKEATKIWIEWTETFDG